MISFLKKRSAVRATICVVFISFQLFSQNTVCPQESSAAPNAEIRYIPIGDSYTIGTGAPAGAAWPDVLVQHLREKGINITMITNPSYPGWTTQQALGIELPILESSDANFATLMIGVNDYYAGVDQETFRSRLGAVMDQMVKKISGKYRVVVITIPDFSLTPTGSKFHPERNVSHDILAFNDIIKQEAQKRNLPVADILKLSQKMAADPGLTCEDGLHPSILGHELWAKNIFPVVYRELKKKNRTGYFSKR